MSTEVKTISADGLGIDASIDDYNKPENAKVSVNSGLTGAALKEALSLAISCKFHPIITAINDADNEVMLDQSAGSLTIRKPVAAAPVADAPVAAAPVAAVSGSSEQSASASGVVPLIGGAKIGYKKASKKSSKKASKKASKKSSKKASKKASKKSSKKGSKKSSMKGGAKKSSKKASKKASKKS